ncbi:MAG: hypothetical protein JKX76_15030 [Colwellia sp.]|nr:hypothetical protein [Colwellia sp.]
MHIITQQSPIIPRRPVVMVKRKKKPFNADEALYLFSRIDAVVDDNEAFKECLDTLSTRSARSSYKAIDRDNTSELDEWLSEHLSKSEWEKVLSSLRSQRYAQSKEIKTVKMEGKASESLSKYAKNLDVSISVLVLKLVKCAKKGEVYKK